MGNANNAGMSGEGEGRSRVVPLTGGHNFRDIGGYPAAGGKTTAWGLVYRSGTMAELSDEDHEILNALGLRVICDFRSTHERTKRPSRLPAVTDFDIWTRDHQTSAADLIRAMRQPEATAGRSRDLMIAIYRRLPYEQTPSYRELFTRIASGALPIVFHCSAGKDRTGLAAAILLDMLGVSRDIIFEDYVLTDRFFDRGCELVRKDPSGNRLEGVDPGIWEPMMRADPAYLTEGFKVIDARHGSPEGFVREELGLGDEAIAAIRERLLV